MHTNSYTPHYLQFSWNFGVKMNNTLNNHPFKAAQCQLIWLPWKSNHILQYGNIFQYTQTQYTIRHWSILFHPYYLVLLNLKLERMLIYNVMHNINLTSKWYTYVNYKSGQKVGRWILIPLNVNSLNSKQAGFTF